MSLVFYYLGVLPFLGGQSSASYLRRQLVDNSYAMGIVSSFASKLLIYWCFLKSGFLLFGAWNLLSFTREIGLRG